LNLNLLNEFNPANNLISNKIWSKSTLTLWIFRWTNRNLRKREHDWLTSQGRNIWRNRIHNNKMAELTSSKVFIKQGKMWHPTWCASWLAPSLLRWLINLIKLTFFSISLIKWSNTIKKKKNPNPLSFSVIFF
jgi:hypothetical protein